MPRPRSRPVKIRAARYDDILAIVREHHPSAWVEGSTGYKRSYWARIHGVVEMVAIAEPVGGWRRCKDPFSDPWFITLIKSGTPTRADQSDGDLDTPTNPTI
jgi:hypothetical protein